MRRAVYLTAILTFALGIAGCDDGNTTDPPATGVMAAVVLVAKRDKVVAELVEVEVKRGKVAVELAELVVQAAARCPRKSKPPRSSMR